MAQMLTAKQVAEVKGCSPRYIKKIIQDGKLKAVETVNSKNRKTYLVPLDALDEELQHKYYQLIAENPPKEVERPEPEVEKVAIDEFTEDERKEIDFWIDLTKRWQSYRKMPGVTSLAEVDKKFVTLCSLEYPERSISVDTLYRKWNAVKADDMKALVDKRNKWKKGTSSIDETIWQAFLYYYLDEAQHPVTKCLEYTKMWAQEKRPDLYTQIPAYPSFYRRLKSVPEGVKVLGREGHKAFNDRCAPYIKRIYDEMQSNEWWIADNHTFDVMVRDKSGKLHRPYLTAFLDARSGIFTGYYITYNPGSEATLIALRKGILEYGIPDNIYVDNGREFLTFDIGGLGHRKKKPKNGEETFEPPGVFKRLGINMTNAIVRNAKAKIIERRFNDVKNGLSRLFNTYTGGSVVEKPERLKYVLKKDAIYTDDEFQEYVDAISGGGAADINSGGGVQASVDGTFLADVISVKPLSIQLQGQTVSAGIYINPALTVAASDGGDEILKPFETPFEPAAAYEFLKEFHEKYVIKKGDTVVVVMTGSGFYIAGRAVAG